MYYGAKVIQFQTAQETNTNRNGELVRMLVAYVKISFSLQILRKPSQKCSTNVEMERRKTIGFRLHTHIHTVLSYLQEALTSTCSRHTSNVL